MLEKEIEQYFIWAVEKLGGKTYKFKSPTQRGVPDRIACLPNGETWFVELKRPEDGELSELQKLFAEDMRELNQKYVLLDTKDQIASWASGVCTTQSWIFGVRVKEHYETN